LICGEFSWNFCQLTENSWRVRQKLPEWREGAVKSATGGGTNDVQTAVLQQVEASCHNSSTQFPPHNFLHNFLHNFYQFLGDEKK
jgi:hypothetical protein